MKSILAADIGGTNSRFAHFEVNEGENLSMVGSQWIKTGEASSFGHLLELLTARSFSLEPGSADMTVVAAAGPVEGGTFSAPPNIPWDIDLSRPVEDYGIRKIQLINDFVAQAYAARSPVGETARRILEGRILPDGVVAVIGAGTGLGQAALIPDGTGGFVAAPSEGGHTHFPFITREECRFREFLAPILGDEELTGDIIVSGRGLSYIHQFHTGEALEPGEVAKKFFPGSVTLEWAARFYGRACRNYALWILARGGVYIAGGVAARSPELLTHPEFQREFRSSATMGSILAGIPVFLITDQESGLWGAALFGRQCLQRE
jgi:glucokinase